MSSKNIFICYRRDDAEGYPRLLRDRLNARFPGRIFMDVISIAPGADYTAVIQDRVGNCHALIAVIGRSWLAADSSGQRRIDQPEDYVRREIAAALSRNHVAVVPVLVRKAQMPLKHELPPDIAPLSLRNAIEITEEDFDHDVDRLIQALEYHFGETYVAQPPPKKSSYTTCIVLAVIGLFVMMGLFVVLIAIGALSSLTGSNPTPGPNPIYSPAPSVAPTPDPGSVDANQFVPTGSWILQYNNGERRSITFHEDHSYQASDGSGTWSYVDDALSLDNGRIVVTIEDPTPNGFVGEAADQNGQRMGVLLIPSR